MYMMRKMKTRSLFLSLLLLSTLSACKTQTQAETSTTIQDLSERRGRDTQTLAFTRNCATAIEAQLIMLGKNDYTFLPQPADCSNPILGEGAAPASSPIQSSAITVSADGKTYTINAVSATGKTYAHTSADGKLSELN